MQPDLKLTGQNRYPGNNLLPLPGHLQGVVPALPGSDAKYLAATVQINPLEPDICDQKKWGFTYNIGGTYIFASDDGFRWRQLTKEPLIIHGDNCCLVADHATGRYFLYQKLGLLHGLDHHRSWIGLESTNGVHWEGYDGIRKWRECFFADDYDDAIAQQRGFLIGEYYGVAVYRAGEILVSVEDLFTVSSPLRRMFAQNPDGLCHLRLGFSHDGFIWRHPKGRPPFLELGQPGEFDAGFLELSSTFVEHDDDLLLYYDGTRFHHAAFINPDFSMKTDIPLSEQRGFQRIMLAKIKRDRFASLAATYKARFDVDADQRGGDELFANVRCPHGQVRVAIAEKSAPLHGALRKSDHLDGFSFDDCVPVTGDHVRVPVRFRKTHIADIPRDKPLTLRFEVVRGEIFGYDWGE